MLAVGQSWCPMKLATPRPSPGATGPRRVDAGPWRSVDASLFPSVFLFWPVEKEELIQTALAQVAEQFSRYRTLQVRDLQAQVLVLCVVTHLFSLGVVLAGTRFHAGAAFRRRPLCLPNGSPWGPRGLSPSTKDPPPPIEPSGMRAQVAGSFPDWLFWELEFSYKA